MARRFFRCGGQRSRLHAGAERILSPGAGEPSAAVAPENDGEYEQCGKPETARHAVAEDDQSGADGDERPADGNERARGIPQRFNRSHLYRPGTDLPIVIVGGKLRTIRPGR